MSFWCVGNISISLDHLLAGIAYKSAAGFVLIRILALRNLFVFHVVICEGKCFLLLFALTASHTSSHQYTNRRNMWTANTSNATGEKSNEVYLIWPFFFCSITCLVAIQIINWLPTSTANFVFFFIPSENCRLLRFNVAEKMIHIPKNHWLKWRWHGARNVVEKSKHSPNFTFVQMPNAQSVSRNEAPRIRQ